MSRKSFLPALLVLFALLLAACGGGATPAVAPEFTATTAPQATATSAPPTPTPIVLVDGLGREVVLAEPATRVVALSTSITESLFAIGAGDQVVGRDDFSTYPEEALQVESIGSLFGELPAEAILALEPDLVIAAETIAPEQVTALEGLGLTIFWQANPINFDDLYANLREMAVLTGRGEQAEALIASIQARVAAVESALEGAEDRPLVFVELDATDPDNPYTVGVGTFLDTLLALAKSENLGARIDSPWPQASSEFLIDQNPDVILLADADWGITPEAVAARAGYDTIAAVQNGQVFPIDSYLTTVPGPRMVDGLEIIAALLHPDLFE